MFLKLLLVEEKTINLKASQILIVAVSSHLKETNISHSHSKTADSDTVSTYQVSSVQLVTDKKLEAFNKA